MFTRANNVSARSHLKRSKGVSQAAARMVVHLSLAIQKEHVVIATMT